MDILASTLGGHRNFCADAWVEPAVEATAWIDKLGWSGQREAAGAFLAAFQWRARRAKASLNNTETTPPGSYNFAGVQFDHRTHRLCPQRQGKRAPSADVPARTVGDRRRGASFRATLACIRRPCNSNRVFLLAVDRSAADVGPLESGSGGIFE